MIRIDSEFYSSPYYFLLRDKGNKYSLYFSVENTLTEARKKDEVINFDKSKVGKIKKYLNKILKDKSKKSTKEVKKNLEELVDDDGTMLTSRVPILDPRLHPKKTMDQTVAAARITNDPITRGYRTYYGESVDEELEEIDMSKAFGYEETEDLDGKETFKYYKDELELEPDDAKERTLQQGKDPSGKKDKKSPYYKDKNFITRATISEIQKDKMIKMVEDILVNKKNSDSSDITKKETPKNIDDLPLLVRKNLKNLIKHAESNGFTKEDLIKLIKKGE
jgi:hypothetical protein